MVENQEIIAKTAILFKTYGIRTNTMDDIARELGMSKKTLYQYVKDKNELIVAVIDQEYVVVKNLVEKITLESNNSIEELIRINALIINFLKKINVGAISDLRKLYLEIYNDAKTKFSTMFSETILASIKDGKKANIFRSDIDEELITKLHTDRIDQMQENSGFWGTNADSPKVIKEMITYYIRGLVTEEGEGVLNKHLLDFDQYLSEQVIPDLN